ncbi:HAD family hydrolase [Chitinophaga sancti]|uniref:HAD family hydrolase n=1 Tax=Chitinophaga sancti TaxID=1004 RepID=UPI003F794FB0
MIAIENIRHISLDVWMTLIRSNPAYKQLRAEEFRKYFRLNEHSPATVEAAIREVDVLVNDMNEVTGRNVHTFEIYLLCLHKLGRDVKGITAEQLTGCYATLEELWTQYPPVPLYNNLNTLFANIRATGRTISLLSNTGFIQGAALRSIMERFGWAQYFSFQLYSDETGHSKPAPQFFAQLLEKARYLHGAVLSPAQIWHLGDNPLADVEGASNAGMSASLTTFDKQPLDQLLQLAAFDHAK